jgi:diaminopimelate decarboxylase
VTEANRERTSFPERPPAFTYQTTRPRVLRPATTALHCERVPLHQVAEQYGTPLFVYSASAIRDRVREFKIAFRQVPHTLCYSVKANPNLRLLKMLASEGCGFDVVSGGELERVLRASRRSASRTVFSGVGKTEQEILHALKAQILLFNVESESELWKLAECSGRQRVRAPIALRVNPDVSADTHPYISTGLRQHKFGIPIEEARTLYARAGGTRHLRIAGVSVHIGSQITDVRSFAAAMHRVAELVRELRRDGHQIALVDAGGGLGIAYGEEDSQPAEFSKIIAAYADSILKPLRGLNVHLLLEPGRSIVGAAGVLLTRVLYKKKNGRKTFLVVDAAMNDLMRPSLYKAFHAIAPVLRQGRPVETVDVVGPICESGDFLAQDRKLPRVEEGELLAILDAGAYGMSLASNYNTRPRAAETLVDRKSNRLIRRRETVSDLLRIETV